MKVYDLNKFNASLPIKPYCTNDLQFGLKIRPKAQALQHKYIQANDNYIKFLIVDCDHSNSQIFEEVGLPSPNFIVRNPDNNHFHYVWALESPIYKDYINKAKNLAYFAKIQQVYTQLCKADPSYINLITKNPNHQHWKTQNLNNFYSYSLDELADYVELPTKLLKREVVGEGRNCFLFESIRKIAYKEVLFYKNNQAKYEDFYNFILFKLEGLNVFQNAPSLAFNELKNIAKSVAKWTWSNFSATKFSAIQTTRSHKRKQVKNLNMIKEDFVNELTTK